MISEDDSIIEQAKDAKRQTTIQEEKEAITLTYVRALRNGTSMDADIIAEKMNDQFSSDGIGASAESEGSYITIKFTESKHTYTMDINGKIN